MLQIWSWKTNTLIGLSNAKFFETSSTLYIPPHSSIHNSHTTHTQIHTNDEVSHTLGRKQKLTQSEDALKGKRESIWIWSMYRPNFFHSSKTPLDTSRGLSLNRLEKQTTSHTQLYTQNLDESWASTHTVTESLTPARERRKDTRVLLILREARVTRAIKEVTWVYHPHLRIVF